MFEEEVEGVLGGLSPTKAFAVNVAAVALYAAAALTAGRLFVVVFVWFFTGGG